MLFSWKSFASACGGDCTGTMGDKKGGRVLGGGTENGMCFCRNYPVPTAQKWIIPGHPVHGEEQVPRLKGTCSIKLLYKNPSFECFEKWVFYIL